MTLAIVTPVYNDWESFFVLAEKLQNNVELQALDISIYAVNDSSTDRLPVKPANISLNLTIIHGVRNLGHQKAIAIGLCYVQEHTVPDAIVIMDADGEDRPEDLSLLINELHNTPHKIIFAQRSKRYESGAFKVFYMFYKRLFMTVTGENINFGNFSIVPGFMLNKVVHLSEIWNNYPGGILHSKLPYGVVSAQKGNRYHGQSKMNFVSLVIHGLSAMSVYLDVVTVRLLILQVVMAILFTSTVIAVIAGSLWGYFNVPQWIITLIVMIGGALIVNIFISFLLTFVVLYYRSQQSFIPKYDAFKYIEKVEQY